MDWRGRVVVGFTEGILRNILAEYYLDWLLGPTGDDVEHPREVIRRRLEEQLQQEAPKVGARILSVQLGEIKVEDEQIPTQWVEAWRAEGESQAAATRVEGEAELLRMEAVRARAQAEMLITLIRELQTVAVSDAELRPYLLATRLAETLRLMSYDPFTRAFFTARGPPYPPPAPGTPGRGADAAEVVGWGVGGFAATKNSFRCCGGCSAEFNPHWTG